VRLIDRDGLGLQTKKTSRSQHLSTNAVADASKRIVNAPA
jgi:hypothetical protein